MEKEKYLKYKYKYLNLKKNQLIGGSKKFNYDFIKNLIPDIDLKIKNHLDLSFDVFPYNKKLYNSLAYLFKGKGNEVIFLSADWGENYKKKKIIDLKINGKDILNIIENYINKSKWIITLLPFNYNFNRLIKLINFKLKIDSIDLKKRGNLVFLFINNSYYSNYNLPSFELKGLDENKIKNNNYEENEQILLFQYISPNDSVLQLGGNIGTSCILVDKILINKKNNVCVEPNKNIISILKQNKKENKAKFEIVNGIISKTSSNKVLMDTKQLNKYGNYILKTKGKSNIKSYDFNKLNKKYNFNVLFADCEGCLEDFFDDYPDSLKNIKKVIFEKDREDICNYQKIEKKLNEEGFIQKVSGFHKVYLHWSIYNNY